MKFRLRFFFCKLDHIHLIQLLLPGHGHVSGCHTGFVSCHEILQLTDLLLLAVIGSFLLRFFDRINLLEVIVITHITIQLFVFHMIDQIDNTVQEWNIVRDQNEGIFILFKVSFQPGDMFHIQVVGRLIQKKDIRFFQK